MKISAKQYAQSLFEAVVNKTEAETKVALKNFVAILGRDRVLNRAAEITVCFQEIWAKAHNELNADLLSARQLSSEATDLVVDYLKKRTKAKTVILQETVDASLIGGFVLRYDSKIIDGSLKNSLVSLKNKISN